jgi:hypothetical protein
MKSLHAPPVRCGGWFGVWVAPVDLVQLGERRGGCTVRARTSTTASRWRRYRPNRRHHRGTAKYLESSDQRNEGLHFDNSDPSEVRSVPTVGLLIECSNASSMPATTAPLRETAVCERRHGGVLYGYGSDEVGVFMSAAEPVIMRPAPVGRLGRAGSIFTGLRSPGLVGSSRSGAAPCRRVRRKRSAGCTVDPGPTATAP